MKFMEIAKSLTACLPVQLFRLLHMVEYRGQN